MNFVGHAVVAWRERPEPAFAFGAMVPDLSRFAQREPPVPTRDGRAVADGVAAHHRADAAFHDHAAFKEWMAAVVAGMPAPDRGARAAAHVGVELGIDGILLDAGAADAYDEALRWAGQSFGGGGPWSAVVERMQTGEILRAYRSAAGIADRVVSVMNRRPRLARLGVQPEPLAAAVAAVLPAIAAGLTALLDDMSEHSLM